MLVVVCGAWTWHVLRHWPQKHRVNRIFSAIEQQDFDRAYAAYTNDPDWRSHPQRDYSFTQFNLDWGPSGDFGPIYAHEIECVMPANDAGRRGYAVVVRINHRVDGLRALWVSEDGNTVEISAATPACT